ncbi:flippase [Comamonas aquatica]|uniref:flippase n=1 Tax=Comamonas aquatica TaxID=225991 RepID=UPI002447FE34|nr:flippase [Comamonas aquatica]MDH1815219.1 flippase [Comamonas aquatica]
MKLIKNAIYNLGGLGLPLVVAVFCIPVLIRELGEARFGLLTLIWAVVSYFGLFDLGLGRALTQLLAVAIAEKDEKRVRPLVATAIALMAVLGVFAGLLMALLASWGVGLIQSVPDRQETIDAVLWMALAMPAIVLTSGFRGVLEARHAFGIINAIRLPMGLFTFIGPVLVLIYGSARLDAIAGVLTAGRIVACAIHAWYALRNLPNGGGEFVPQRSLLKPLCVSGGWLTLSNIISPLMGYVDRFIIGGIISAAAVAYYTTPQEIVTKLWVVPAALTAVLFPTFSAQIASGFEGTRQLFGKAVYWIYLFLLPITAFLVVFANEILSIWINSEFSQHSANLLRVFSIGILLNCLAHIPLTLIQGMGKPKITTLIHLLELPCFLIIIWWLTTLYGPMGAAIAWCIRIVFDTLLLFIVCSHLQKWKISNFLNFRLTILIIVTAFAFSGFLFNSLEIRFAFIVFAISVSIIGVLKLLPRKYFNFTPF